MPKSRDSIGRRRFIKAVPAAVAATVTLPKIVEGQRGGGAPPHFGKDALKCAEQLDGVSFTDAEEEMAAPSVSRNLDSYEELRKLTVPLDTEPAITFRPYLPGKQPTGKSSRDAKIAVAKAPRRAGDAGLARGSGVPADHGARIADREQTDHLHRPHEDVSRHG